VRWTFTGDVFRLRREGRGGRDVVVFVGGDGGVRETPMSLAKPWLAGGPQAPPNKSGVA
jgi:hypothetical protein